MIIFTKKQIYFFVILLIISLVIVYNLKKINFKNEISFKATTSEDYELIKNFFSERNNKIMINIKMISKNNKKGNHILIIKY